MQKFLYLVDDDTPSTNPGFTVNVRDLGYPDLVAFENNLRQWITERENLKYFFNIIPLLPEPGRSIVITALQKEYINMGTFYDGVKGLQMMYHNRKLIKKHGLIQGRAAPNSTAIVVMAGPSLENDIKFLKESQGSATLFCCDAVLRRLLSEGIEPDFVVSTERISGAEKFFEGLTDLKTTLIATQYTYNPTVLSYKGPVKFILADRPEVSFMYPNQPKLFFNPYVLETTLSLVNSLFFDTVLLSGVDLIYGDKGESHASLLGASDEAVKGTRDSHGEGVQVECFDGVVRETSPVYMTFIEQTNDALARMRSLCYSLNPKGARLAGVNVLSHLDATSMYLSKVRPPLEFNTIKIKGARTWPQIFRKLAKITTFEDIEALGLLPLLSATIIRDYARIESLKLRGDIDALRDAEDSFSLSLRDVSNEISRNPL